MPCVGLQCVIVVIPGHTYFLLQDSPSWFSQVYFYLISNILITDDPLTADAPKTVVLKLLINCFLKFITNQFNKIWPMAVSCTILTCDFRKEAFQ